MLTFAFSHIAMSAKREWLIQKSGKVATSMQIVGTGLKLPSYWPGDSVGKDLLFPDSHTAGRQLYRFGYTLVSVTTLGSAFTTYLTSTSETSPSTLSEHSYALFLACATAANTASLASLVNASPLGLMPGFEQTKEGQIQRNDAQKFIVRGLTRITRHPLILPVVPWGIANSILVGNRLADWILFGGLSLYAIAGCAAQDWRVIRKEGSVGTVFEPAEGLQEFFQSTSFIPFGAVMDGRQNLVEIAQEVPWYAIVLGSGVGYKLELAMLHFFSPLS